MATTALVETRKLDVSLCQIVIKDLEDPFPEELMPGLDALRELMHRSMVVTFAQYEVELGLFSCQLLLILLLETLDFLFYLRLERRIIPFERIEFLQ